jgi:hypothetical protein
MIYGKSPGKSYGYGYYQDIKSNQKVQGTGGFFLGGGILLHNAGDREATVDHIKTEEEIDGSTFGK